MQLLIKKIMLLAMYLFVMFWALQPLSVQAQVSGLSFTLSPTGEYVFWDDKAGLANNFGLGANVGFGFGELIELRGTYMQMLNQETYFSNFGIPSFLDSAYTARSVDLSRIGGELKLNLSRGKLLPYLTLGTGIQTTKLDTFSDNKNIYASAGLGLVLSAADRYTLTLEGKNTAYNFNAVNRLMNNADREAFALDPANFDNERLQNWSVNASLTFYLGGRRPGSLTDIDRAYADAFGNGFKNISFLFEPTLAKIEFDEKLPYRNTWLGGANIGVDLGPLVGVRAYYLKGMNNEEVNLDFDDLAVYGGDFRFKLNNVANGLAPFLSIGGGYINAKEGEYIGRDSSLLAKSQAFAAGGGGIVVGLGTNLRLRGGVKAMLTTSSDVENIETTDEITTSLMYSVGLNLAFGKKQTKPDVLLLAESEKALEMQASKNAQNAEALQQQYETRALELESQLNEAYAARDIEKAAEILQEKTEAEAVVAEIEARKPVITASDENPVFSIVPSNSRIQLSPAEFESLIEEILESMGVGGQRISPIMEAEMMRLQQQSGAIDNQRLQSLENRLLEMERLLIQMNERQNLQSDNNENLKEDVRRDLTEFSTRLLLELKAIEAKIGNQNNTNQVPSNIENQPDTPENNQGGVQNNSTNTNLPPNEVIPQTTGEYLAPDSSRISKVAYTGMSAFAGFNVGKDRNNTVNFGLRWHYKTGIGSLEFMPEAFFGLGSPSNFGIMANIVQPIKIKSLGLVTPYIGTGFGFMQIGSDGDNKLKGAYNIILGSYLNVAGGRLYVDLTGRNLFKNNQLIAGYRFNF